MSKRLFVGLGLVLPALAVGVVLGPLPAFGGPGLKHESFAAPAFVPVESSTHNNNAASACGAFVASQKGDENRGDLNARTGSFLANVRLPHGVSVKRLTMYANDFSADDAHVYLVRKRIQGGLDPQFKGYKAVANTKTSGAANGVMRKFTDTTVKPQRIDNERFYYFLELVVCDAIEPFAVQVSHQR